MELSELELRESLLFGVLLAEPSFLTVTTIWQSEDYWFKSPTTHLYLYCGSGVFGGKLMSLRYYSFILIVVEVT